jgi:hypothetical protein
MNDPLKGKLFARSKAVMSWNGRWTVFIEKLWVENSASQFEGSHDGYQCQNLKNYVSTTDQMHFKMFSVVYICCIQYRSVWILNRACCLLCFCA